MISPNDDWTPAAIEALFECDLHELGARADAINRGNGNLVTYVVNRHINYTNICTARCPLCAFYRAAGEADAYQMCIDEVLEKAAEAVTQALQSSISWVGSIQN